ncbi:hypothetical protein [Rufibacter hautae]|uniref:hypothetical protein n=1 Tax=Rufibacter hautae TaxID=2595005 RepID=UPI0016802665|nr:hypothetical protein [Rufibacter hautae]
MIRIVSSDPILVVSFPGELTTGVMLPPVEQAVELPLAVTDLGLPLGPVTVQVSTGQSNFTEKALNTRPGLKTVGTSPTARALQVKVLFSGGTLMFVLLGLL